MVLVFTLFVFYTPYFKAEKGFSYSFYLVYFLVSMVSAVASYMFYVSVGAFQARISDKAYGGTYITFTSLWLSVGRSLTNTPIFYLIDLFSIKNCDYSVVNSKPVTSSLVSKIPSFLNATQKHITRVPKCSFNSDLQV